MASYWGPKIELGSTVPLVTLDPFNLKTVNDGHLRDSDHGVSEWVCVKSGSVRYISIYDNTSIKEFDGGFINDMVSITNAPENGSFSVTAGSIYYANNPFYLIGDGNGNDHNIIVPSTFAGRYFNIYWGRSESSENPSEHIYNPFQYKIFSLFPTTTINFYNNTTNGCLDTATSTTTTGNSAGAITTIDTTSGETLRYHYFKTDKPVLITAAGNGTSEVDKTIMSPASTHVYGKVMQYARCMDGTDASNKNSKNAYDSTDGISGLVCNTKVGDGSGGDSNSAIGINFLSDTYAWGQELSDYTIVAPYPSTTVTVSYANANGGSWIVGETHNLSSTASLNDPDSVGRDGDHGFGVPGDDFRGMAVYLASGATRWKFEGNKPFSIVVNDTLNDEEKLLGWMSDWETRQLSNTRKLISNTTRPRGVDENYAVGQPRSFVNLVDVDATGIHQEGTEKSSRLSFPTKNTRTEFIESNNTIKLEKSNTDYIDLNFSVSSSDKLTIELWAKVSSSQSGSVMLFGFLKYDVFLRSNKSFGFNTANGDLYGISDTDWNNLNVENNWTYYTFVMHQNVSYTNNKIYINGVSQTLSQQFESENASNRTFGTQGRIGTWINTNYLDFLINMDVGLFKLSKGELTSAEILNNYHAIKSRFAEL